MNRFIRFCIPLLFLAQPGSVLAHRVNVFAYAEGDRIHVEGRFQRAEPARFSEVEVGAVATNKVYLTGKTDAEGRFVFTIPVQARTERADLRIRIKAGEGHQNEWTLPAGDYLGVASAVAGTPKKDMPGPGPRPATTKPAPASPVMAAACPPAPDITGQVEAALERKIAPLRQMLLDGQAKEPGLRDIVGGIGYLLGIAGLLAYARAQRLANRASGRPGGDPLPSGGDSDRPAGPAARRP